MIIIIIMIMKIIILLMIVLIISKMIETATISAMFAKGEFQNFSLLDMHLFC